MKKALTLLFCVCLMMAALPTAVAEDATFTLMIYMCGTDLESDAGMATTDLMEMMNSGVAQNPNVTVYVQTGGTKTWQVDEIANGEAERWAICEEGLRWEEGLGKQNMGDAAVLADFIASGFEKYPADRYGLIFWDHGSGASGGLCYDEISEDALFMPEIYDGLVEGCSEQGEKPFEFIGFDACLMASYEVANHIAPFAAYMVASEELEPGTGWSYDGWLPVLADDPAVAMEELGAAIVDSFVEKVVQTDRTDYATLSVVDLGKLEALKAAVETMAGALSGEIDSGSLKNISRLRQNVRSFGEIYDAASDMVDLTTFAEVYGRYDQKSADAIKAALKDAVVYSRHTSNLTGVTGLSILVPFSTRQNASEYMGYYEQLDLSPDYNGFVEKMLDGVNAGAGSLSFGQPSISQQSIQEAQIDWFSQYAQDPQVYQEEAGSLWNDLYGEGEETQESGDEFSLDSFLNTLFASESSDSGNFNTDYDDSVSSLWGDTQQYSDNSFATDSGYGSGLWGALAAAGTESTDEADTQAVTVAMESGDVTLNNPFADAGGDYAYTVELTQEQLDNLGKVEANLMMDVSEPDFECYVELGYVQDVVTDWQNGKIYGMFEGVWATLDGQMVCLYDQIANDRYIRSLIPVKLNGEECYLLVIFDEENPGGRVTGATEGYTESGAPARAVIQLNEGDVIIPMYELLYWDENDEQQSEPFEGDEIVVGQDGSIPFEYAEVEADADYLYGFCLTDIYGDYQFTEFLNLTF